MTTDADCWAPYGAVVAGRLAACEYLLAQLRRSLAGEIAHDRFSFSGAAHRLRDTAQSLVDGVDDVEWLLGTCLATTDQAAVCGLATGHGGPHHPIGRCREHQTLLRARLFATGYRRAVDRMAWSLLAVRAQAAVADIDAESESS